VKLIPSREADIETRKDWWIEIREEIRSHCRSLNCNTILGYRETTSVCDGNVCILFSLDFA